MKSLKNRVVALTGASSGIGQALAVELAKRGAHLSLSDVDEVGLARIKEQCEALGASVFVQVVDVASKEALEAWAEATSNHFGVVHAIINNAGIAVHGTIEELPDEVFERVMQVNFWGVVHGTRAFLPYLKRAKDAHVVNLSSLFGLVSIPGQSVYNASKFAVRGFSEALIQELAILSPHVHCTCVHPGGVKTNIARAAGFVGQQLGSTDLERLARRFDKMARTTPESAARQIIEAMLSNKRRLLVGQDAVFLDLVQRLLPSRYHDITLKPYRKIFERDRDRS